MQKVVSFASTVIVLSLITAAMELLLPSGPVKTTSSTAAGPVFLSAVCDQILGIITGMGV